MAKHKCMLPKYELQEVISIQEAKQQIGWSITAFDLPKAWEKTQGEGVKIAVVDTGCDLKHPDLVDNLLPGINLINTSKPPLDDNGHGTHATGIICASNNEIGVVGSAPGAKVMPIKVLDKTGNGDLGTVAIGVRWAVDNGADFISMSLGSPRPLQNIRKAIQYAESKGVVVFCAAGNMGLSRDVFFPSAYPETIAIGSIDENFDRSKFSNTGKNLDFLAPGGKILSTTPNSWYGIMSGTSQACPWVVGIAALCLAWQRKYKPETPLRGAQAYRDLFAKHCISVKGKNNKQIYQGFGIIDPRELLKETI